MFQNYLKSIWKVFEKIFKCKYFLLKSANANTFHKYLKCIQMHLHLTPSPPHNQVQAANSHIFFDIPHIYYFSSCLMQSDKTIIFHIIFCSFWTFITHSMLIIISQGICTLVWNQHEVGILSSYRQHMI